MEIKLDHKFHISYLNDNNSKESYLCYSCRKILPSYTKMEKRDGPKKPERLKLYPSREILKIYLTNDLNVWKISLGLNYLLFVVVHLNLLQQRFEL